MSQADIEKAYTEAVDQLARAVEANRLLTERLQAYEVREGALRSDCHAAFRYVTNAEGLNASGSCGCGEFDTGWQVGQGEQAQDILAILDRPVGASQDEQPPASPGVPT